MRRRPGGGRAGGAASGRPRPTGGRPTYLRVYVISIILKSFVPAGMCISKVCVLSSTIFVISRAFMGFPLAGSGIVVVEVNVFPLLWTVPVDVRMPVPIVSIQLPTYIFFALS